MSDFFGGILDNLRGFGDDVAGFFDSALSTVGLTGSDIMKAAKTTLNDSGKAGATSSGTIKSDSMMPSLLSSVKYKSTETKALTSVDPKEVEAQWIQRMQAFANTGNK